MKTEREEHTADVMNWLRLIGTEPGNTAADLIEELGKQVAELEAEYEELRRRLDEGIERADDREAEMEYFALGQAEAREAARSMYYKFNSLEQAQLRDSWPWLEKD